MKISGKYLYVLIGMCGLLASGVGLVTNVSGLFFNPIAEEFSILRGSAALMLTICNISLALGGMLVPRILKERTLKPLLIGATAVLAGSTAGLALCPNIVAMYVLCVLRGLSAGLVTFVFATTVLNNWFEANIGLATSIAMGCSGIAGAAFSPIVGGIIGAIGWRAGFVLLGVLTVLLNLPAILLLPSLQPETAGLMPFGATAVRKGVSKDKSATSRPRTAPRIDPTVFVAVMMFALLASAATALPQHFPAMSEEYGLAFVGATMLSVTMVANTLGKIALGALIDRFGTKLSTLAFSALVIVALVLLLVGRAPAVLVVAAGCYGLCYALGTVAISMLTRDAFGLENYGKTYPTMSLSGNIANAVFSSVVGFIYDFSGGYAATLVLFIVLMGVAVASVIYVYARKPCTA